MSKLLLSLVLIVCVASRVTNGQGELTCVLCDSIVTNCLIYCTLSRSWLCPQRSGLLQWLYCVED